MRSWVVGMMSLLVASTALAQVDALATADQLIADAAAAYERVSAMEGERGSDDEEAARRRCLQERLSAMEGLQVVAAEARDSLALTAGSANGQHYLEMITVTTQQVLSQEAQARQCTGSTLYVGATSVDAYIDPKIPNSDTTDSGTGLPGEGPGVSEREEVSPVI